MGSEAARGGRPGSHQGALPLRPEVADGREVDDADTTWSQMDEQADPEGTGREIGAGPESEKGTPGGPTGLSVRDTGSPGAPRGLTGQSVRGPGSGEGTPGTTDRGIRAGPTVRGGRPEADRPEDPCEAYSPGGSRRGRPTGKSVRGPGSGGGGRPFRGVGACFGSAALRTPATEGDRPCPRRRRGPRCLPRPAWRPCAGSGQPPPRAACFPHRSAVLLAVLVGDDLFVLLEELDPHPVVRLHRQ